jgi:hypothetical protein
MKVMVMNIIIFEIGRTSLQKKVYRQNKENLKYNGWTDLLADEHTVSPDLHCGFIPLNYFDLLNRIVTFLPQRTVLAQELQFVRNKPHNVMLYTNHKHRMSTGCMQTDERTDIQKRGRPKVLSGGRIKIE